jgi:hypothetical protein
VPWLLVLGTSNMFMIVVFVFTLTVVRLSAHCTLHDTIVLNW